MTRVVSIILILLIFSTSVLAENLSLMSSSDIKVSFKNDTPVFDFDRRKKRRAKSSSTGSGSYEYFMKSLAVPGWGEYELGYKEDTKWFLIAEGALIAAAIGFTYYSGVRTDDYKSFARTHAGVNISGKNEQYWINISNYNNVDLYNQAKSNQHDYANRYEDPNDAWYWDNAKSREKFDDIRIEAENFETMGYYMIGGIVANHLISAINASYKSGKVKPSVETSLNSQNQPVSKFVLSYNLN